MNAMGYLWRSRSATKRYPSEMQRQQGKGMSRLMGCERQSSTARSERTRPHAARSAATRARSFWRSHPPTRP